MPDLISVEVYRQNRSTIGARKKLICKASEANVVANSSDNEYFRIRLTDVVWKVQENGTPVHPSTYLKGSTHENQRFSISANDGTAEIKLENMQMFWVRGVTTGEEEEDAGVFKYDLEFQAESVSRIPRTTNKSVVSTIRKPIGKSLHVGLNDLDPGHYGTIASLRAAKTDSFQWLGIVLPLKYKFKILTQKKATRNNVITYIKKIAKELESGDVFLLTFAGHGTRINRKKILDIDATEPDGYDNAWCLYDGLLFDAELFELWTQFKEGVRIIVASDSCHSGSFSANIPLNTLRSKNPNSKIQYNDRYLEESVIEKAIKNNEYFYKDLIQSLRLKSLINKEIKAKGRLLAACKVNQKSREILRYDDDLNFVDAGGALILGIREAKKSSNMEAKITGKHMNFGQFFMQVTKQIAIVGQTPQHHAFGKEDPNFLLQKPFEI